MFERYSPADAGPAGQTGHLADRAIGAPPGSVPDDQPPPRPPAAPADDPPGARADDPPGARVGTLEWAAELAASGEPLGTVLVGPVGPALVPGSARDLVAVRMALGLMDPADSEAEAIDRVRVLEQLKAACAAAQVRETHALDVLRRSGEAARGVPAEKRGRGLAGEIGLARGVSPHQGSRYLKQARTLAGDLPRTLEALTGGGISEEKAAVVHRETAWLPTGTARAAVDADVAGRLPVLGVKQLAWAVRELAVEQDPVAALAHFETAVADRRVTVTPTRDGMATLTATIPLVQAVACHRALADTAASAVALGEAQGRTGAQVLADTLVERLTGQATAAATPVEVHLVMTDTALFGTDSTDSTDSTDGTRDEARDEARDETPARVPGHGSLPAGIARRLVAGTDAEVFVRRLYTAPDTGQLVAMDSTRRTFPAPLRRMVVMRDDLCRTPYCDARIKHLDHATPHAAGGATSWANASGLCARCNYAKQHPGWTHTATPERLEVTTPTGHRYDHPTPPLLRTGQSPPPAPERPRIPGVIPLHLSTRQVTALIGTTLLRAA